MLGEYSQAFGAGFLRHWRTFSITPESGEALLTYDVHSPVELAPQKVPIPPL